MFFQWVPTTLRKKKSKLFNTIYIKIKPGQAHPTSATSFKPHLANTGLLSSSHTGPTTTHQDSAPPVLYTRRLFQVIEGQKPPPLPSRSRSNTSPSERRFSCGSSPPSYIPFSTQLPHHSLFDTTLAYFIFSLYLYHSLKLSYLFIRLTSVSSTRM